MALHEGHDKNVHPVAPHARELGNEGISWIDYAAIHLAAGILASDIEGNYDATKTAELSYTFAEAFWRERKRRIEVANE